MKIINVPDATDIDFSSGDPAKNHLILDYIDNISYEIESQGMYSLLWYFTL